MQHAVGIALVALVGLVASPVFARDDTDRLKVGSEAPRFTLKVINPELSGERIFALRKHVGGATRAVVLSFAASYCEPCKKELPELKRLAPALDEARIELVVVVTDQQPEGQAAMKALTVDRLALPFMVVSDRFGIVSRRYQAENLPKTVIIRRDGTVQWMSEGFDKKSIAKLRAQLGLKS